MLLIASKKPTNPVFHRVVCIGTLAGFFNAKICLNASSRKGLQTSLFPMRRADLFPLAQGFREFRMSETIKDADELYGSFTSLKLLKLQCLTTVFDGISNTCTERLGCQIHLHLLLLPFDMCQL